MNVLVENKNILTELAQIATMNYGQMQRWRDFIPLNYSIEIDEELFLEKIADLFAKFREAEIEEDETDGFPELIAYKRVGWPGLRELAKGHTSILRDLIIYHQYEILHLVLARPKAIHNYYYSLNSIDEVQFENKMIRLKGICFQSDYIEHTFNHELPRKYALLKNRD